MTEMGARGLNENRFCKGLGTREIGGYAIPLYLQYKKYDIS